MVQPSEPYVISPSISPDDPHAIDRQEVDLISEVEQSVIALKVLLGNLSEQSLDIGMDLFTKFKVLEVLQIEFQLFLQLPFVDVRLQRLGQITHVL